MNYRTLSGSVDGIRTKCSSSLKEHTYIVLSIEPRYSKPLEAMLLVKSLYLPMGSKVVPFGDYLIAL